ncbi:hypothetical protein HN747_01270 [archaeon]|nr:hypothetical protein [archaeon]
MIKELRENLREEISLLELIRGEDETAKTKMTSEVLSQIKILNDSYLDILSGQSDKKKIKKEKGLTGYNFVHIPKKGKAKYKKTNKSIGKAFSLSLKDKDVSGGNPYISISAKLFGKVARKLEPSFSDLTNDLRAANIALVTTTYLSLMFFSCVLSLVAGVGLFALLGGKLVWSIVLLPLIVFFLFYTYPSSRSSEINKKINYEISFATIHMAAIAGSNIGAVRLFEILSESNEYPNIGFELKKVLNQVKVFGYNVTNSLKNVASKTRNIKLSELLGGLATNINTGGQLKSYLEKKSESYLVDYKLERQKYIDLAGTFLDIYISILIAAPLILILLLMVMSMIGASFLGMGLNQIIFISIVAIIVLNIIFIIVLNIKQPEI